MMSLEALDTSMIEGERLDRDSVQSSIRQQLGLATGHKQVSPAEAGISEMMVTLCRSLVEPLCHDALFAWHRMIMRNRHDLSSIGCYRTHTEAMQIASRSGKVHFEGPPSHQVPAEMERFLEWFQRTAPKGSHPLPAVTRAGLAHLWFESIHPFEDGNGRIGRAIAEKALAQGASTPVLTAVAGTLLKRRKDYYQALESASRTLEITDWLLWFASVAIESQRHSLAHIEFILNKTRLLDLVSCQLNPRQEKAVLRMLAAGPDGFTGGMSAGQYMGITGTLQATTTRDLDSLVKMGVLNRTGERKATRYHLNVPLKHVEMVRVEDIL